MKSDPIPEVNNEPVKVVVRDSIQDMVFNSGKNGKCLWILDHCMISLLSLLSISC